MYICILLFTNLDHSSFSLSVYLSVSYIFNHLALSLSLSLSLSLCLSHIYLTISLCLSSFLVFFLCFCFMFPSFVSFISCSPRADFSATIHTTMWHEFFVGFVFKAQKNFWHKDFKSKAISSQFLWQLNIPVPYFLP